jgi:hypothetical protein
LTLQAFNLHPRHDRWQLVEGHEACPEDDGSVHVIVRPDGGVDPDSDFD